MVKKTLCFVLFLLVVITSFSQKNLNDYKYVIVPSQYEFQKKEDSYKINSLTKFLFKKEGFETLMSTDIFPDDLSKNRCLALTARLNNNSGMLLTKMNFDLLDCSNKVVFSTKEAKTKEKEYLRAYRIVIRKTFEDIIAQNYKYSPKTEAKIIETTIKKEPIKEIVAVKKQPKSPKTSTKEISNLLHAKPIKNGFNLLDNASKIRYSIQETSLKNVFIIKDKNGILHNSNGTWIAEYYIDNELVKEILILKF